MTFPTDDNNIGSDSDIDPQDEDVAKARTEHETSLSQRSEEIPQNGNQDSTKERTMFRTSDDMYSNSTETEHMSEIKDGVLPVTMQTQSSSPLSSGHLQTLDFSSAHSQQFLKLGAPLLFHPGQLSMKPEGLGHLLSSLPGVNNLENGGLSSQSLTSPSPFMFHLSQHMLASQVRFSRSTLF